MSRSGTTLLATVLDSHPGVSMGYELMPAGLGDPASSAALLRQAAATDDPTGWLKERDQPALAGFLKRAGRCLCDPIPLAGLIEAVAADHDGVLDSPAARVALSAAVAGVKAEAEGNDLAGFKLNVPSVELGEAVGGEPRYIFIVRDPRDVVASHLAHDFGRTIEHITDAWVGYVSRFLRFSEAHPDRALLVRYEDLACLPDRWVPRIARAAGVEPHEDMRRFFEGRATIHAHNHRNAEELTKDFFTSSIGRWRTGLDEEQVRTIDERCGELMERVAYAPVPRGPLTEHGKVVSAAKELVFRKKAKFYRDDYGRLVLPLAEGRINVTWAEACSGAHAGSDIFLIRHDIDHDLETAVRIAEWEHEHGLRSTFCVLHTAWYYARDVGGVRTRTQRMVEACRQIQSLGHEVNLHNNAPCVALREGGDAWVHLAAEVHFLRGQGLTIVGTAQHGDGLNREAEFRNQEIFAENVREDFGGRREVWHDGRSIELGEHSMFELGLTYEGYDLPRDIYITDSGGNPRLVKNTRGRNGVRRKKMDPQPPYPTITGVLTHPIWWDMERDAPDGPAFPSLEALGATPANEDLPAAAHPVIEVAKSATPATASGPGLMILCGGLSRSGTTLTSASLDAHPDVAMGYELAVDGLGPRTELAAMLRETVAAHGDSTRAVARALRDRGSPLVTKFVKRAARSGCSPESLVGVLENLAGDTESEYRHQLPMAIVGVKRDAAGRRHAGFKASSGDFAELARDLPQARFVCLVRDPRDVFASQRERGFQRSASGVGRDWARHVACSERLAVQFPGRVAVVRYEDLVCEPARTIPAMCGAIGLDFHDAMLEPENDRGTLYADGQHHPVGEQVARGIFTTSVGRATEQLDRREIAMVERHAGIECMARHGYEPVCSSGSGVVSRFRGLLGVGRARRG